MTKISRLVIERADDNFFKLLSVADYVTDFPGHSCKLKMKTSFCFFIS